MVDKCIWALYTVFLKKSRNFTYKVTFQNDLLTNSLDQKADNSILIQN